LGERAVCDWLYARGIAHTTEPQYPRHPEFNPSERLRADWQLGNTFVEFAGMMTSEAYAKKISAKRQLAAAYGIPLVVILPEDLLHLDVLFAPLLRTT
jgi:2-oxoglutarate dehydrogenase complex dehydrogenase (E1) component-like enzyme